MYFGYSKALGVTTSTAVLALSLLAPLPAAEAASVAATGTDAAICNQEVSDNTNVTAVRLAGGDCVITFTAGITSWVPAKNLKSVKILLVGGGGGGGGSYDTAGAGGGGAGQVLLINSRRVTPAHHMKLTWAPEEQPVFILLRPTQLMRLERVGPTVRFL